MRFHSIPSSLSAANWLIRPKAALRPKGGD